MLQLPAVSTSEVSSPCSKFKLWKIRNGVGVLAGKTALKMGSVQVIVNPVEPSTVASGGS